MFAFVILANVLVIGSDPVELHHFRMDGSGYRDDESCKAAAKSRADAIFKMIEASPQIAGQVTWGCERSPTHGV